MDDTAHYPYSLNPYFLIPSFIICDGINSFMQSTMVLSIRSLIQSSLMYREDWICVFAKNIIITFIPVQVNLCPSRNPTTQQSTLQVRPPCDECHHLQ